MFYKDASQMPVVPLSDIRLTNVALLDAVLATAL